MFKLFKRESNDFRNKVELVIKIFSLLPVNFMNIRKQISEGILTGCKYEKSNFTKFSFRTNVLNKYEDKKGDCFEIKGIKIFDKSLQSFTEINLEVAYGIFIGYSTPGVKNIDADLDKIDVKSYWVKSFENVEFKYLENLLTADELKLINPNDVYQLELGGQVYYHLKDFEDGDFIGINEAKRIFKFTQDPYNIIEINDKLSDVL